jgi:hypothetical protein
MLPQVDLQTTGHVLTVQPACSDVLECLMTVEHTLTQNDWHGTYLAVVPHKLFDVITVSGDGGGNTLPVGVAPAGLTPVVTHLLRKQRYHTQGPARAMTLPEPDLDAVQRHGVVDQSMLDLLQYHERGLVYYGPKVQPLWLVAQAALAYPELTIVVAAATLEEAQHAAKALRRWLPGRVTQLRSDRAPRNVKRIVVGNYEALLGSCADLHQRGLMITLHAIEFLGKRGMDVLSGAEKARLLGFMPLGRQLAPRDADQVRAVFGFQECHVPLHGRHPLPVDVVFEDDVRHGRRGDSREEVLRRSLIWQHVGRNRRIARLARALQNGDETMLAKFRRIAKRVRKRPTDRLAVLVDNLEHGLDMAKRLPDWELVTGAEVQTDGLSKRDQALLQKKAQWSRGKPTIFTTAAGAQIEPQDFDTLIRADAGTGLLPISEDKLTLLHGNDHRLLMIDFDNQRHRELRRWTRLRQQAYRQRGWYCPGAIPLNERVTEFLATRPITTQV